MPSVTVTGAQRERALAKLLPHNRLLAALPGDVHERLLPHLALADLPAGHQLGQPDGGFARAYFPITGVVALMQSTGDGERIGALVGHEGAVGLPRFMSDAGVTRFVVQSAGYGLALGREQLLEEWGRGDSLMRVLTRYSRALAAQKVALTACRGHHSLDQQLAALLMMSLQRLPGQEVVLTQDATARLLGVTPYQLAGAVERLRDGGAATWRGEGMLAADDHAALGSFACGCPARIASEYQRLLPHAAPPTAQPSLASQSLFARTATQQRQGQ
jgi:hypothetical protein